MNTNSDSPAVATAYAHVRAWSNHDFDAARRALAPDIKVTATTTQPAMPSTNLTGIEDYMRGLVEFAGTVVPGSEQLIASVGDERNALLLVTVEVDLGAGKVTLPAARLYLLDERDRIASEQVIFYAAE
jgi:SnoaL-like domain